MQLGVFEELSLLQIPYTSYYIYTKIDIVCIVCVYVHEDGKNRNCFHIFVTKDGKIIKSLTIKTWEFFKALDSPSVLLIENR